MLHLKDLLKLLGYGVLVSPMYAYLTFYFVYPVISPIAIGFYPYTGFAYVIYSLLIGLLVGIFFDSQQHGFIALVVGVFIGYVLSIFYQCIPYFLYGYTLYISGLVLFDYIERSFLLPLMYVIFGLIGLLFGGVIRDWLT